MRRQMLALALLLLVVGALAGAPNQSRGQEFPTPRGQLGGHERLPTSVALPTPPVPSPTPTVPVTATPTATSTATAIATATATATPPPTTQPAGTPAVFSPPGERSPEEVAALVRPAVVTVVVTDDGRDPAVDLDGPLATASGFFFGAQGQIVTSAGAIGNASAVVVFLADGERRDAVVVGTDPPTDVALLRVEGVAPAPLPPAATAPLAGQTVVSIGTPEDLWAGSVERKTVLAVDQAPVGAQLATGVIGLDGDALPGIGGAPVVDLAGGVVGMRLESRSVVAAANPPPRLGGALPDRPRQPDAPRRGRPQEGGFGPGAGSGISFVTPTETVQRVAAALAVDGRVRHPYLGAILLQVTPTLAVERGLPSATGAIVEALEPDGPMAAAGGLVGDTLLAIDGEAIGPGRSIGAVLYSHRPGDSVRLTVGRGEQVLTLDFVLGQRPDA